MALFDLLRSSVSGERLPDKNREAYSTERLRDLFKIAHKHDVQHLVALGLKQNELVPQGDAGIEKCILKAVYRYEQKRYEYENLCNALEKAEIPFLPLKGSVIQKYYPEAWMRTSCDIDVLVHEEDLEKAIAVLTDSLGYTYQSQGSHDVSLYAPFNVHIELHYTLIEEGRIRRSAEVLETVWDTAVVRSGFSYWYEMPDEMLYFYHISHMAKHFEEGGCGIRPFIDLWILDNIEETNEEKRNELLERGALLKFATAARKLSQIWFENEDCDFVSQQMEDYILRGGVYGSNENRVVVQQQKQGGWMQYALSKIFLPYDVIKFHYPILQKHRALMPVMQVRRWGKLIFCGHAKRSLRELEYNSGISSDEAAAMQTFLKNIGL